MATDMQNNLNNIRVLKNVLLRPSKVDTLPVHMQIETTNACNLRCLSCHRDLLYPKATFMSFERFKAIFDQVKPQKINVSGLGEPFLNREIISIIRYAKQSGATVNCATNFTVAGKSLEQIVDSGLDQLKISIDAASRDTYYKIRGKDLFDATIENIERINQIKKIKNSDKPALRFNFALQRLNIDELCSTVELAHELGIEAVYVQYLEYIGREDRRNALVGGIDAKKLLGVLKQADALAKRYRLTTNINIWLKDFEMFVNKMDKSENFVPNAKKCYFPWFSIWVDVDGMVRPCPIVVWQSETAKMGNVYQENLIDIWNNQRYRNLRKALKQGVRPTRPCKFCIPQSLFNILYIGNKLLKR